MADERYVLTGRAAMREQGPQLEDGPCIHCKDGTLVSAHGDRGRASHCGQCGVRSGEHARLERLGEVAHPWVRPHDPEPPRAPDLATAKHGDTFTEDTWPFSWAIGEAHKAGWLTKQIKQSGRWVDAKR